MDVVVDLESPPGCQLRVPMERAEFDRFEEANALPTHAEWYDGLCVVFDTLGLMPLLVAWPGRAAGTCDALTTTVDLHATLCDVFGVQPEHRTHGRTLAPLIAGTTGKVRDHVLTGYWGRHVHVVDDKWNYGRSATGDAFPLAMWSNRWSTMPTSHVAPDYRLPRPDGRATLAFMPGSTVPVIRRPFQPGDLLPFWAVGAPVDDHHLYSADDETQEHNEAGSAGERDAVERLRAALDNIDAPPEQYERLGLS